MNVRQNVPAVLEGEVPADLIGPAGEGMTLGRIERQAGLAQGLLLTAVSTLSVMGVVLLTPVLPLMEAQYADVPGSAALVRLALTLPALCIFLLSPLAGLLADKVNRRHMLLAAMLVYAVFGTAPFYLQSLWAIIASRVGVGIAEAALMTASTTLIGDYFSGAARERWYAAQTGISAISAIALFLIGGALGEAGWHVPFLVYGVSLVMFVPLLLLTWEPTHRRERFEAAGPFPWARTRGIYFMTLFGAVVFYVVPIQLPFILNTHGITAPSQIGFAAAMGGIAVPLGSALFAWQRRMPMRVLLVAGLMLAGFGFLGITYAPNYGVMLGSVLINQFGCGLYLPALLNWAVGKLPFEHRGRGSGIWMASFFLGQFSSPLLLLAGAGMVGGLLPAVTTLGLICLLAAAAAWGGGMRGPSAAARKSQAG